jgi:zinc transport system substrate-binding protein
MVKRALRAMAFAIVFLGEFGPWDPGSLAADGGVLAVASIVPLGGFCRELGGPHVEVEILIPPGASPHVFEPRPSVIFKASSADVLVYVGGGLDRWAHRIVRNVLKREGLVVRAIDGLELLPLPGHIRGERDGEFSVNPHVWLDPVLAMEICRRISKAFEDADPLHAEDYRRFLERYLGKLHRLHEEIARRTRRFRLRRYVAFHSSFSYFARRYQLEEVEVIEPLAGREPTARRLAKILSVMKERDVRVVFAEVQLNPRAAQIIAREAGARLVRVDPLGGRPPYGEDYIEMMRHNLDEMESAMK